MISQASRYISSIATPMLFSDKAGAQTLAVVNFSPSRHLYVILSGPQASSLVARLGTGCFHRGQDDKAK